MRLTGIADYLRVGPCVGSFLGFRLARLVVRGIILVRNRLSLNKPARWMGFSELVGKRWGVAFLVITAPRWNCHATIALTDSFPLRGRLSILTKCADGSAEAYSFVVYPESGMPFTLPFVGEGASEIAMDLPPGRYRIGARYYGSCKDPEFPEVRADGVEVVKGRVIAGERDRYREQLALLRTRDSIVCRMLHYYVFHFLSWRVGGEDFMKREFLPVGNPDTEFDYDAIREGDVREIVATDKDREKRVYVTLYNRQSFPVFWTEIKSLPYPLRAECDGFYLVRRVAAHSVVRGVDDDL